MTAASITLQTVGLEPGPVLRKAMELLAGVVLVGVAYASVVARRSDDARRRRRYRRYVLQAATGFVLFAYAAAVLVPNSQAWPVELGTTVRYYFANIEAIPRRVDTEMSLFYGSLQGQIGTATGATAEADTLFGELEHVVRVVGLVTYTLLVSLASLGAQVPGRALASVRSFLGSD